MRIFTMPTSTEEATKIITLSKMHLSTDAMKSLFVSLDEEVGKFTDNSSLQVSLKMLRGLVDPSPATPEWWVKPAFYTLVAVHMALIIGMMIAFVLLPFKAEWYIALPLYAFIFFFSSNRVICKLTILENILREKLHMKKIGGFVSTYFVRPAKLLYNRFFN